MVGSEVGTDVVPKTAGISATKTTVTIVAKNIAAKSLPSRKSYLAF